MNKFLNPFCGYIAIVISLFALYCSCFSNMDPALTGFVLGALSLLVTALIGWQIVQYIFADKNMRKVVDESSQKLISDFTHVVTSLTLIEEAKDYDSRNKCLSSVDTLFSVIQELNQCNNQSLRENNLYRVAALLLQFFDSGKDEKGYHVLKGKKALYLSLIDSISTFDTFDRILNALNNSIETEPDYYQEYTPAYAKVD